MDPAVVGSSEFRQLFKTALPGNYKGFKEQIFSQPLVYTPNADGDEQEEQQYVYFSSTQNNVYKLNAQTGAIIASRNLHIPFLTADLDGCVDIADTIGIVGTGVIDPETETLYLTAKTYEDQDSQEPQGRPAGRYFIHALDVNDLSERPGFPVDLEGTVARNSPGRVFNGGIQLQRPALLHLGQHIYIGFGSHCVQYKFTGWIIGIDKTTGAIVERFATLGEGIKDSVEGGGVWMAGGGIASDDAGSLFYATGNGYASQLSTIPVSGFNPPTALEQAAVHMTKNEDGSLNLVDFFMPREKQQMDGDDKDLGSSPLQMLPKEFSCGAVSRIGVITGKNKKTYWLNLDDLGGYRTGPNMADNIIGSYLHDNSVYAGAGVYPSEGGGGYVYINVVQYPTAAFRFSCDDGVPSFTKVASTDHNNAYILGVSHGTVTTLDGQPGTGLLWNTDVQGQQLRIYDAVPRDGVIRMIKSFSVPGTSKFTRAVFGDGIMYMGTTQGFVYGFGAPVTPPLNCTSSLVFDEAYISRRNESESEREKQAVRCEAVIGVTVEDIALVEGDNFALSGLPTTPLVLQAGSSFTVDIAFAPVDVGLVTDRVSFNTTNSVVGYRSSTSTRVSGTGRSDGALLSLSPNRVTFNDVITSDEPNGLVNNVILANLGESALSVDSVLYSVESADGPWQGQSWDGEDTVTVGKFTVGNLPTSVAASSSVTLAVQFDSSSSGTFDAWVRVVTSGGSATFSIQGHAGARPVALIEFQTPDGEGWVELDPDAPFTFGNVTQNTARALQMRITNDAPEGIKLSLTVSKPPFGIDSIIRAANQVDLAEGTLLGPGESASAVLSCSVPKSQYNVEPYSGTASWTMTTNDGSGKDSIEFFCNADSQQAPPLLDSGIGKYQYVGCFKEDNPGRQLERQLYGNDDSETVMCIDACADSNYIFCGTQYHRECWAGNKIPNLQVADRNCNYECAGDLHQICGGNGEGDDAGGAYISLFADVTRWDGNTTIPGPDPGDGDGGGETGGPVENPGVAGYASLGCYTEATTGRALPFERKLEGTTVAKCVAACSDGEYPYAGLEYASEVRFPDCIVDVKKYADLFMQCWCGHQLGAGSVPAESGCTLACNGKGPNCGFSVPCASIDIFRQLD